MKIRIPDGREANMPQHAFTVMEVLIAMVIVGTAFVSLYLGMTQGFAIVQLARENLRATQILQEKMETIRLYTWPQINTANFIPQNFTDHFYPQGTQNTLGTDYSGTMTISPSGFTEVYADDMRLVTVTVTWQSGNARRQRTMYTYVSQYGLHDYIY